MEDLSVFAVSMTVNMGLMFPPLIEMDLLDEVGNVGIDDNNNSHNHLKTRPTGFSLSADFIKLIMMDHVQYKYDIHLIKYWSEDREIASGTSERPDEIYTSLNGLAQYYKSVENYSSMDIVKNEIQNLLTTSKIYESKKVYWFLDAENFVKTKPSVYANIASCCDHLEMFVFGNITFLRQHVDFMKMVCGEFKKQPERTKLHLIMCNRDIVEIREKLTFPQWKNVEITGDFVVGSLERCPIRIEGNVNCKQNHWKNGRMNVALVGFVEKLEDWMFDEGMEHYQISMIDEKINTLNLVKEYLKSGNVAFCQCYLSSTKLEYCLILLIGENETLKLIRLKEEDGENWKKYLNFKTVSTVDEKVTPVKEDRMYAPVGVLHEKTFMKKVNSLLREKKNDKNVFEEKFNNFIEEYQVLGVGEEIIGYLKEISPDLFAA